MNIDLWRTALANTTVAVPVRAREPENNAPTDLQEGYKIDKHMYVYTTLTKYTSQQALWVQEVHTSTPALYGPNYCPHYPTHTHTHTHTSHVCMHKYTLHVCMHTHVTCMHVHTHTSHVCMHTHTSHVCTHTRHMYACTHTHVTCMHTHVTCMHAHTHTHIACMHTHTHTHIACMHAHTHIACMHTHTSHVCMHTHTRHMYAHTHTSHACMHTHTHTSHVCMHTHTRRMYAHTHTHVTCMHAHTHTHTRHMYAHTHTHSQAIYNVPVTPVQQTLITCCEQGACWPQTQPLYAACATLSTAALRKGLVHTDLFTNLCAVVIYKMCSYCFGLVKLRHYEEKYAPGPFLEQPRESGTCHVKGRLGACQNKQSCAPARVCILTQ